MDDLSRAGRILKDYQQNALWRMTTRTTLNEATAIMTGREMMREAAKYFEPSSARRQDGIFSDAFQARLERNHAAVVQVAGGGSFQQARSEVRR